MRTPGREGMLTLQSGAICWAYEDNGAICRRPAVAVDPQRGCTVCERHRRKEGYDGPERGRHPKG